MPEAAGPTAEAVTTSITPLLSVRGGAEAIAFYQAAFAAQELSRFTNDLGHVVAQLSIDTATFIVADEAPDYDHFSPDSLVEPRSESNSRCQTQTPTSSEP